MTWYDLRLNQFALDVEWIGSRVLTVAAAAAFLSGLALVRLLVLPARRTSTVSTAE